MKKEEIVLLLTSCWLLIVCGGQANEASTTGTEAEITTDDAVSERQNRGLFSPRVEYNEWTPLGRGDPLKNDPTYDYVPPVLDRVHYWIETTSRSPLSAPPTRNKQPQMPTSPSSGPPEEFTGSSNHYQPPHYTVNSRRDTNPFMTFVDGPKFNNNLPPPSTFKQHHLHRPFQRFPSRVGSARPHFSVRPVYMQPPYPFRHPATPGGDLAPAASNPHASKQDPFLGPHLANTIIRPPYTILLPPPLPATSVPNMTDIQGSKSTPVDPQNKPTSFQMFSTTTEAPTTSFWATLDMSAKSKLRDSSPGLSNDLARTPQPSVEVIPSVELKPPFPGFSKVPQHKTPNFLSNQWTTLMFPPQVHHPGPTQVTPPPTTTTSTTTAAPTTTTMSLTTDPIFSHYKQPTSPIRGPLYLIIEGHSKVKTYGAGNSKRFYGIPVNEDPSAVSGNEISNNLRVSKRPDDRGSRTLNILSEDLDDNLHTTTVAEEMTEEEEIKEEAEKENAEVKSEKKDVAAPLQKPARRPHGLKRPLDSPNRWKQVKRRSMDDLMKWNPRSPNAHIMENLARQYTLSSGIRPVFFNRRLSKDISDPFEYHNQLKKLRANRLPSV